MAEDGLAPDLQFGEFCWWYFTNRTAENPNGGMAYFHEEITAAAQAALGRPLHLFTRPRRRPGRERWRRRRSSSAAGCAIMWRRWPPTCARSIRRRSSRCCFHST